MDDGGENVEGAAPRSSAVGVRAEVTRPELSVVVPSFNQAETIQENLREIARRLGGRAPDVGTFTTLMQQDVERRSEDLLQALERERQQRQKERQEQQQQQQQQNRQKRNKLQQQRQKLVSLIAELEMLKRLGIDRRRAADDLRSLVEARGDDSISNAEVELIERLAHSHTEISKLFAQIKAGVEEALQAMQGGGEEEPTGGSGRGRNR